MQMWQTRSLISSRLEWCQKSSVLDDREETLDVCVWNNLLIGGLGVDDDARCPDTLRIYGIKLMIDQPEDDAGYRCFKQEASAMNCPGGI